MHSPPFPSSCCSDPSSHALLGTSCCSKRRSPTGIFTSRAESQSVVRWPRAGILRSLTPSSPKSLTSVEASKHLTQGLRAAPLSQVLAVAGRFKKADGTVRWAQVGGGQCTTILPCEKAVDLEGSGNVCVFSKKIVGGTIRSTQRRSTLMAPVEKSDLSFLGTSVTKQRDN